MKDGGGAALGGLWGASSALALAAVASSAPSAFLVLTPGEDAAEDLAAALLAFGVKTLRYPAPGSLSRIGERLLVLRTLGSGNPVLISSLTALGAEVPTPSHLEEATLTLAVGQLQPPEALAETLHAAGLQRVESAEAPGEFARRGGILDVFPPGETAPLRIEWDSDRISSLRSFDPETQHSGEPLREAALVLPSALAGMSGTLLDHLPGRAWLCLLDPALLWERIGFELSESVSRERLESILKDRASLSLAPLAAAPPAANLPVESSERLKLGEDLSGLAKRAGEGWTVAVTLGTEGERKRFESAAARFPPLGTRYLPLPGRVAEGFCWGELKLIVLDGAQLLHQAPARPRLAPSRPIESFLELKRGDYVVHLLHGIGRFRGLQTLPGKDGAGKTGEYLAVEYQDQAVIYVPVSQVDLVQKYVGSGAARPKLSKVGEKRWALAKAQAVKATEELAQEMLRIQAQREIQARPPYVADAELQQAFEAGFPFAPTPDQEQALQDMGADLAAGRPMDRLVCGDVGCGKTELAVRAAFRAASAGRQTAVLVPTTVLAQQHLETFSKRLLPFGVRVEGLTRFQTRGDQNEVLQRLADGETDVVVGTHRLLQKDVAFRDLALLIVDEEQRFGVAHKQALKRLKATLDVLTLTATPIPRTLHGALLGLKAISNIQTLPEGRQAIRTTVCPYSEGVLTEAVRREMARGGQAFVVHNRVHSIDAFTEVLRRQVPEARFIVAHGQMEPEQLEEAMVAFVSGQADVLVATTIIESGLDIPNANTLVVHEAHRFGLSDLHQLRGRVGRSAQLAYAYFLLPEKGAPKGDAAKRLKAIEEFCELGAGFHIALRDLEIRGAGNLLGPEQSGHIAAVGYELYCRLLERSVKTLKGEAPESPEAAVEIPVEAYLPEFYLPDPKHRMEQYRLLARARSDAEVTAVAEALKDLCGPLPEPARRLLDKHRLRLALPAFSISLVGFRPEGLLLRHSRMESAEPLFQRLGGTVRPQDDGEVIVAAKDGSAWPAAEAFERLLKATQA